MHHELVFGYRALCVVYDGENRPWQIAASCLWTCPRPFKHSGNPRLNPTHVFRPYIVTCT